MSPPLPYQRMVLLNETEYARLVKQMAVPPEQAKSSLPPDQLQKINAHALEEEIRLVEQSQKPTEETASPSQPMLRTIIDKFPLQSRARGHSVLQKLLAAAVSWDDKGQVKLADDDSIVGSNIVDLIHYASNTSSKTRLTPVGWENIASLLGPLPTTRVKKPAKAKQPVISRKRRRQVEISDDYLPV